MRSVRVSVVGSAPGRAMGASFERRADGRLRLLGIISSSPLAEVGQDSRRPRPWFWAINVLAKRRRTEPSWIVGLSSAVAVVRRLGVPAVAHAQRQKLLAFEAGQLIAAPPEALVWVPARFPGLTGESESLVIGVAKREDLECLAGEQAAARRLVDRYEPRCMAVYRAFRYNHPSLTEGRVLIVDLHPGGQGFSVLLSDAASFAVRAVKMGAGGKGGTSPAWSVGEAAAGTSFAERVHLEVARLIAAHETAPAVEPHPVVRHVFLSCNQDIYATAAGPLSQRLGLPVERLDPFRRVEVPPGLSLSDCQDQAVEWVGLAVAPSARCPGLDLSPPRVRSEREHRTRRPYVRAALIGLFLAPVPPASLAWRETARELRDIDRLRSDLGRLAPMAAELRAQRDVVDRVRADAASWQAVRLARTQWVEFLDDLQSRVGTDGNLWLDRLERLPPDGRAGAHSAGALRVCGGLRESFTAADGASSESRDRIEAFFEVLKQSPWIDGIDQERFTLSPDSAFRFDAVLTCSENSLP